MKAVFFRLTILSFVGSFFTLLSSWSWLLEVNANFGAYYLIFHCLSFLFLICIRTPLRGRSLVLCILFLLSLMTAQLASLVPFYVKRSSALLADSAPDTPLRILYANLYSQNARKSEMRAIIERENPDIIALVEVDAEWVQHLNLAKDYGVIAEIARPDNFGIALYSRYPTTAEVLTDFGDELPPAIVGEVAIGKDKTKLGLAVLHAFPPLTDSALYRNELLLRRITSRVRHAENPFIVAGDFNSTPFSNYYHRFNWGARVSDAMWGYGLLRTWNADFWFMRLTLDRVLYKGGLAVKDFRVLEPMGSDHLPIVVDFNFSPQP